MLCFTAVNFLIIANSCPELNATAVTVPQCLFITVASTLTTHLKRQSCSIMALHFLLIAVEAENILGFERELVALPGGLPTPASLDEARMRHEEARRLNKVHELFI